MTNKLKKRQSFFPSIVKLLYIAIFLSTFLTCLVVWMVKYDNSSASRSGNKILQPLFLTVKDDRDSELRSTSTVKMKMRMGLLQRDLSLKLKQREFYTLMQGGNNNNNYNKGEEGSSGFEQVQLSENLRVDLAGVRTIGFELSNEGAEGEGGNSLKDFDLSPDPDTSSLFPPGAFLQGGKMSSQHWKSSVGYTLFPQSLNDTSLGLTNVRQSETVHHHHTTTTATPVVTSSEVKRRRIVEFLQSTGTQLWKFKKSFSVSPSPTVLPTSSVDSDSQVHTLTTTVRVPISTFTQDAEKVGRRDGRTTETSNEKLDALATKNNRDVPAATHYFQNRTNLVNSYCSKFQHSHHNGNLQNPSLKTRTNFWIRYSQNPSDEKSEKKPPLTVEWCPIFKAASSPWMALLMAQKKYLSPRTESLIRRGEATFVKLAKTFHMHLDPRAIHPNNDKGQAQLQNSTHLLMLVVRHPFERILSAYRDKLERVKGRSYYHRKFGLPIIRKFRRGVSERSDARVNAMRINSQLNPRILREYDENPNPSIFFPPQLPDDIITSHQMQLLGPEMFENGNNMGSRGRAGSRFQYRSRFYYDRSNGYNRRPVASLKFNQNTADLIFGEQKNIKGGELIPTFEEFVRYLLSTLPVAMDEHWRPMYIDCNACKYRFDLILQVETMDQDRDFVLELLGVHKYSKNSNSTRSIYRDGKNMTTEYLELDNAWKRWTNSASPKSKTSNSNINISSSQNLSREDEKEKRNKKTSEYFSQVSENDLKLLYKLYEPDFLMFGYSPQKYFEMSKKST